MSTPSPSTPSPSTPPAPRNPSLLSSYRKPTTNPKTERLSLPPNTRMTLGFGTAFLVGSGLGLANGGTAAGMRFRAENAHRLPTSQQGWYFYHKSKNYHTLLGGAREGGLMGLKVGLWVTAFLVMEEAVDQSRGAGRNKDFLSTLVAAAATSGAFSAWNRFPITTAARTAKMGVKIGLGYGLLQDGFSYLQGRRLGYVELVRSLVGKGEEYRDPSLP
ncbi:hypothetical protein EJ06DRAFT_568954 [Trichodelitschia bisporula]|uniref:Tim17-domain-containing protein n=1 Tax=Trichodelitschia bisporula TaxID=703511 RepID=A0A6G1I8P3_9PEZI|nr:hypothetical protein EJ06DRAFT_568954 [Trichodelitschia bisporula]